MECLFTFLECCETIILFSDDSSFNHNDVFGPGTYIKATVDSRDRMIYRNNAFNAYGFGDFVLEYEGPNEGGRRNWIVSDHE